MKVYAPKWPSTYRTTASVTRRSRAFRSGSAKTSRTDTVFSDGRSGTTVATATNTAVLRPLQSRKVVRQLVRLARYVPSGMPTTVAIEMPDSATADARLAWRSGTRRIAMLTPMAQNTPLAKPMASRVARTRGKFGEMPVTRFPAARIARSADSRTRRFTRLVHATRNGTPSPAETPYRVTISPATPSATFRLRLTGVSRPTGINSVVTKVNRLAVMTATPAHAL